MSYKFERRGWGDVDEVIGRYARGVCEVEQKRLPGA